MGRLTETVSDFARGFKERAFPATQKSRTPVQDRMHRDIKGSLFGLITIFELIALTSYIPIDSFNLFNGRIDHINNMGGVVGAAFSEWFLGTLGIMGYTIIIVSGFMAFLSFRGQSFKEHTPKFVGALLFAVLGAISCQLSWGMTTPEASLLQGGFLGRFLGTTLERYLNTSGAVVFVIGGYLITLILTTGLSILNLTTSLFGDESDETESFEAEETPAPVKKSSGSPKTSKSEEIASAETKKTTKRTPAKRKKKVDSEEDSSDSAENIADDSSEEENAEVAANEGPKIFECSNLVPFSGSYSIPSNRLLKSAPSVKKLSKGEIKENAAKLVEHLLSFQITGDVVAVSTGPVLTTYEYKPSAGMKLSKIAALQDDLGVVLGTRELRIIAPIPGKTVVGIEVPRPEIETISLKDCLGEKSFSDKKLKLPIALGKTTDGVPVFGDLAAMPHLLVAGATGSGKSVFVNSLITSFLFRMSPQQLRMILVDPKMLELNVFDGLPHLITNVITDNKIAFNALSWAVWEMDRRYGLMAKTGSKNIDSYNEKVKGAEKLPFIVIVVDELADLMMSGGEAVEIAITRLAQKARAAGIHMVIATQRPSTDVVTGLIKANIPSRISFKVPSGIDSRTVLDTGGAEDLIGRGDCLMIQPSVPLRRLHGTFVTEEELKRVVKYCIDGKDHSDTYIDFSGSNPALEK